MAPSKKQTNMLVAQAMRTANLADYQKDSIVSRTLIDKNTGTVTFFAFDKGQGLSEHTAPFDALVYLLDGEAEISISGKPFSLRQGEMIIMPANEPHALKAVKQFKMILTMIKS
jgi:quercetin dioxygenase-like cupin family protein